MTENKLSSAQMPEKFMEWLLAIGCPAEKVPTLEKVTEMCRGHYYMVWRSVMEHVEAKDVIRQKRLQVFCDDVNKWKRKNMYKNESNVIIPDNLALWHQHNDIKDKVTTAETTMEKAQQDLNKLMEKISSKLSQRNLSQKRLQDVQRRVWLLQHVVEDLKAKKKNLEETKSIADSLCLDSKDVDVQSKLDKYVSGRRPNQSASVSLLAANPVASSSVMSGNGDVSDAEDQLSWVSKCRGQALWHQLCERRSGLVAALAKETAHTAPHTGVNPQKVLAHTAAMHCSLALEAMKHRVHIKHTQKRLKTAVVSLNNFLSGEACELLVIQSERAQMAARVDSLRALLADMLARSGVFCAGADGVADDSGATGRQIAAVDRSIENKKEELKRTLTSLATTERKMVNVRECLVAIFGALQKNLCLHDQDRYKGQIEFPQESIATLRQFYEERREARRNKLQLSLDLDVSDNSYNDIGDNTNPKFTDELKTYFKTFCLEKNRKLVLESGEKIWINETISAAIHRLHSRWQDTDSPCTLVCPSVCLSGNLKTLVGRVKIRQQMEVMLRELENGVGRKSRSIDLSLKTKEDEVVDKIKKRLNENILNLQKTNKTLDLGQENLKYWSDNIMKKYISQKRVVNGKSYNDYEVIYMENFNI